MVVDRFLGAGYASVHGPSDPRALLTWTLDQGFAGLLPAPAPRDVDWRAVRAAMANLPISFAGLRLSSIQASTDGALAEAGLAASDRGELQSARAALAQGVETARVLGCPRLILEPGLVPLPGELPVCDLADPGGGLDPAAAQALFERRNQALEPALEQLCRSLHWACKSFPDMEFCLTLSRDVRGLGEPLALQAVFEDLPRRGLSYWHDTVAAACREQFLAQEPGTGLDLCSKQLIGMTLGDFAGAVSGLPPGSGGVDYPLLSAYRQRSTRDFPVVIELDPGVDPGELPGVHAFLGKIGL